MLACVKHLRRRQKPRKTFEIGSIVILYRCLDLARIGFRVTQGCLDMKERPAQMLSRLFEIASIGPRNSRHHPNGNPTALQKCLPAHRGFPKINKSKLRTPKPLLNEQSPGLAGGSAKPSCHSRQSSLLALLHPHADHGRFRHFSNLCLLCKQSNSIRAYDQRRFVLCVLWIGRIKSRNPDLLECLVHQNLRCLHCVGSMLIELINATNENALLREPYEP
jgi:hypothetical protein